jgi:hypothetical protein
MSCNAKHHSQGCECGFGGSRANINQFVEIVNCSIKSFVEAGLTNDAAVELLKEICPSCGKRVIRASLNGTSFRLEQTIEGLKRHVCSKRAVPLSLRRRRNNMPGWFPASVDFKNDKRLVAISSMTDVFEAEVVCNNPEFRIGPSVYKEIDSNMNLFAIDNLDKANDHLAENHIVVRRLSE